MKKIPTVPFGRIKINKMTLLSLLVILLPALQAGAIALFYYVTKGATLLVPQWNDEGAYYELIKTWLANGQPLGYWGFDGGHAIVGTGSAWSPAILLPYAVWGMMFGWGLSSAFFANLFFLMLAQALFLLLTRPQKNNLYRILLLQMVSVNIILYLTTLMSEVLRFSLAIVLAGMIYRLYFGKCGRVYKYLVLPIYLLTVVQVYIFFVFAIPLYVWGVMEGCKPIKRVVASFAALLVVGGGSYYLLHLISSNYNIYKTENLLAALQRMDIMAAIRAGLGMFKDGLWGLYSCFHSGVGHGLFGWFVPFLFLLALVPLGSLFVEWKKNGSGFWQEKKNILASIVCVSLALFMGAFVTVYSMEAFTFFRSMGIPVLFSMYLLATGEKNRCFEILLVLYALGMFFLPANMKDFAKERYVSWEVRLEWEEFAQKMEQTLPVDEEADPWKNTVALYTLEPKVLAGMPAGSGVNMMLYSDEIPKGPSWLFFSKRREGRRSDWLEHDYWKIYGENVWRMEQEYRVVFEDEEYILYRKMEKGE